MFHTLRKIQKKERDNGTLAHVEETFYDDIHKYLNELKQSAIDNPFSDVYNTLNEARRIATEICEKREYKITNTAVLNINRSFQLFVGEQEFDLVDSMPLNLTPEEEVFYFSLIDTLKNHKLNLSGQDIPKPSNINKEEHDNPENQKTVEKNDESEKLGSSGEVNIDNDAGVKEVEPSGETNVDNGDEIKKIKPSNVTNDVEVKSRSLADVAEKAIPKPQDDVLNRIDEIAKAKIITNEKPQSIEKQISSHDDIEIIDDNSQFIDLDSHKRIRDAEIVTLLVFDNIDSIMGIDEKVYGPFRSQDIVTLPRINANIFVKSRKGRLVKI